MRYIIEMKNIIKTFPGVMALNNVSFSVKAGSVHALVGENGAGKSTLMKILNGVHQADSGEVYLYGQKVHFKNTFQAQKNGIGFIFQECNLVNELSAAENIFINRYKKNKLGKVNWKHIYGDAQVLIDSLGFNFNVKRKILELSSAEKQLVEIAKALSLNAKIIVMDEPTSSLTTKEVEKLFEIINHLKKDGITVIYISHKLEEIYKICDTITVLRDGEVIDTQNVEKFTKEKIIELMVGRSLESEFPKRDSNIGDVVMKVQNLSSYSFLKDISFELRKGEVLGIAGLVGAGRTELAETIFGAVKKDHGEVFINNLGVKINSTSDGIANSIGMVPEDRKETGLVLEYNLIKNTTITNLKQVVKCGLLSSKKERAVAEEYRKKMNIKTPSVYQNAINLSGGNQQKVVMSKWLFSNPDILILDEPTRGIDVGAKYEIYLYINQLAKQGKSIIFISSELSEVIGMSDRILVLSSGRIMGELSKKDISAEAVMKLAIS